jgi:serine protease Do
MERPNFHGRSAADSRECLMRHLALALPWLLLTAPARADDRRVPSEVLALQEAVEKVIERAEPSIACILVSRSEEYAKKFHAAPPDPTAGKLGRFDSKSFLDAVGPDDVRRRQILKYDLSFPSTVPESYGSGVVLDARLGLVLTNAHVVRNATKLFVRLPGGAGCWADIHASDPRSDLAVLRLLDPPTGLKALPLIDLKGRRENEDVVRKGQIVVSLANPFAAGFRDGSPSASWGIVSNLRRRAPAVGEDLDRSKETLHHYGTLIQTDARLNLGCSGGALLNLKGELVGLTTALAALSGSETPGGFAVPFDARLQRIVAVLLQGKEVEYGFLGVGLEQENRRGDGVVVKTLVAGSPASRAGLQENDVILKVNGVPVHEKDDLFLYLGAQLADSTVELVIDPVRPRTVAVKLAKFYVPNPAIAANRPTPRAGLRVEYSSILLQRDRLPHWLRFVPEGVLITEVVPGSPADRAKLQPDKIITRVNDRPVRTPAEFYREMDKAKGPIALHVYSDRREEKIELDAK